MSKAEITALEIVYSGWGRLMLATVREDGRDSRRQIEDHGQVVAVLPYDPVRRVALLVRITRAPVLWLGEARDWFEAPAGLIDPGEAPDDAVRREAMEEVGLRLTTLERVGRAFATPGSSTETMTLYLAPFTEADCTGAGGGAAGEDEHLTVLERPLADLWRAVEADEVADMKTLALLQALKLRRPELFG